jgi:acetaldehyde dehydrogenase/alcohol dehydrogenase
MLGITGKTDEIKFQKLVDKIIALQKEIELPLTIKEAGVDETKFLENIDQMSEDAFNDQCTGANPRYPLISEMKELYLQAYYGEEVYNRSNKKSKKENN